MTMKTPVELVTGRPPEPETAPFTDFIVKVHSRCDLACDYCYMYPPADHSWRARPPVMPPHVVDRLAERIAEHVRGGRAPRINLLLHGGEPLLAGPAVLRSVVESVRAAVDGEVVAGLQTNGLRLTKAHLELFAELEVSVGLSLDGPAAVHDRHRVDRRGRGSHAAAVRALELIRAADVPGLFAGLLCVVDVSCDPVDTLEALLAHRPPTLDLLLPHASWAAPPARPAAPGPHPGAEYGVWLAAAFDHWYGLRPPGPQVRLFQEILAALCGGPSASESVGLSPSGSVVIETDGGIEQVDALKTIYPGAAATGLDVFRHSFDDALAHPGIRARRIGAAALADACRACELGAVCGGGFYAHRYRPGTWFKNPSVYCADLFHLISHVRERIRGDLAGPGEAVRWAV
jgi:uncharacterized protein